MSTTLPIALVHRALRSPQIAPRDEYVCGYVDALEAFSRSGVTEAVGEVQAPRGCNTPQARTTYLAGYTSALVDLANVGGLS